MINDIRNPAFESVRSPYDPEDPLDWSDFHQKISRFFTVGEVLQFDIARRPYDVQVIGNILALCDELDKVRDAWGSPIGVTSWYRPEPINQRVGGVPGSQHTRGSAADIYTMDGRDAEFEAFLDASWGGGLGYGVASGRGFTHVDMRGGSWKSGSGAIRWRY